MQVEPPRLQLFKMTGADVAGFIQNYVTADIVGAPDGAISLGTCCNRQGRALADLDLIRLGESLYVVLPESIAPSFSKHLAPYMALGKISMEPCELNMNCLAMAGLPAGLAAPKPGHAQAQDDTLLMRYATSPDWVLCWQPSNQAPLDAQALFARWWHAEVAAGRARITPELSEQFLPQALGFEELGGISYTKGCYLGQEIVARAHYKGSLKQSLHKISATGDWQADAALKLGATIVDDASSKLGALVAIAGSSDKLACLLAVMRAPKPSASVILQDSSLELSILE